MTKLKINHNSFTMKRFFYFMCLLLLPLTGCSVMAPRDRYVETLFLDYRPFSDLGFFFSPDPYPGEFDALGEIQITVIPAIKSEPVENKVETKSDNKSKYKDRVYSNSYVDPRAYQTSSTNKTTTRTTTRMETISSSELMEIAYNEAIARGADGIVNFRCKTIYTTVSGITTGVSHEISGLAIKRK